MSQSLLLQTIQYQVCGENSIKFYLMFCSYFSCSEHRHETKNAYSSHGCMLNRMPADNMSSDDMFQQFSCRITNFIFAEFCLVDQKPTEQFFPLVRVFEDAIRLYHGIAVAVRLVKIPKAIFELLLFLYSIAI